MKCIILAAGYATRLYPLTKNFPKPLLKVADKTILDWLIDDLVGIDEFLVVSNHRFASFFEEWAKGKEQKITVIDDQTESNETRLGAVKDIQLAAEYLEKATVAVGPVAASTDVLVMAGDNILDFSLNEFVNFAKGKGTSCVMCHEQNDLAKLRKTAVITLDDQNCITSYEEKPFEPKGNLAVPPFYYYKAEDLKRIPEALAAGCGYDAPGSFAAWLSGKTAMHAFRMPGKRYDIGDMASYRQVREIFE